MTSVPLVSVMLATYNQVNYVGAAIRSVLEQDYPRIELVVTDDGSTDGTAERVAQAAEAHPDVVVPLLAGSNSGMHANFNRGLRRCTGRYVAFHAGDDLFLPGKLGAQVAWMDQDQARVLCGHDVAIFTEETGEDIGVYSEHFPLTAGRGASRVVREGILFSGTSVMVRRSALPVAGYDETLHLMSDWKLHIEVLAGGGEYGHVPGVLARYRRHAKSVTADISRTAAALERGLDDRRKVAAWIEHEHPELAVDARALLVSSYLAAARTCLVLSDRRAARRLLGEAVRADPAALSKTIPVAAAVALPTTLFDLALHLKRRALGRTAALDP